MQTSRSHVWDRGWTNLIKQNWKDSENDNRGTMHIINLSCLGFRVTNTFILTSISTFCLMQCQKYLQKHATSRFVKNSRQDGQLTGNPEAKCDIFDEDSESDIFVVQHHSSEGR